MRNSLEIIESYKSFYNGQENYYHNFMHAKWEVIKCLSIMDFLKIRSGRLRMIISHAMSGHDAGHSNGVHLDDMDNVQKAIEIFDRAALLGIHTQEHKMARTIILATAAPYAKYDTLEEILCNSDVDEEHLEDLQILIEIARDADHMGIIGIQDESKRKQALVGLFREHLKSKSKETLLSFYEQGTNAFFDSLYFNTSYGKKWAKQNLEESKRWQLAYSPVAIELASK